MAEKNYDVCVIGSGAAGGVLAAKLAADGARVVLIEGGPYRDPSKLQTHAWPYDQVKPEVPQVMVDQTKEPHETTGDPVHISRARVLGGRTTHWNAVTLRFAENDFREASVNGVEEDWPISYRELAPYYGQAERLMVVCGTRENLEVLPDGEFIRPLKLRCSEQVLRKACEKLDIRLIPVRKALVTEAGHGRLSCHYCGHCMRGCGVSAIFNTAEHVIPKGRATGRLDVRSGWMAHQLLSDEHARVTGVRILERESKREEEVRADVFGLCCGNVESARLLLNSRSPRFPNGLGNSNDVVGRYLHGHVVADLHGYLTDFVGRTPFNQDGATDHAYIPRFKPWRKPAYTGGYGVQINVRSYLRPHHAYHLPGFGDRFKRRVRDLNPAQSNLLGFGKVLARAENRVKLHPDRKDAYGLPIPVVQFHWSENDRAIHRAMLSDLREIYETAGVELLFSPDDQINGFASHGVGTVRMGNDPRTSALNKFNQSREIANLFVVDGSCFTTMPEKNPTLTIVALALRTADQIMAMKNRREL